MAPPDHPQRSGRSPDLLGRRLGHYRVTELLGAGGLGEVWAARDETLERRVALKAILGRTADRPESKRRFLQEARVLSRLEHPGICQIFDYLETEHGDFLVLELIEGRTLRDLVGSDLSRRERVRLLLQILDALVAAHKEGIVHRDLKPENVMVTAAGEVKVLDFGLARSVSEEKSTLAFRKLGLEPERIGEETLQDLRGRLGGELPQRTDPGGILGTPAYMSPEQARGQIASPAADMYSFGLVLRELLSGERTLPLGTDAADALMRAFQGEVPELRGQPAALRSLAADLAARDHRRRPSAIEARSRLAAWLEAPRRRLRLAIVGLALVALAKFGWDLGEARQAARTEAEARAVAATRADEEAARARRAEVEAREVSDFLIGLFELSDPGRSRGESVTARELLDRGADRLHSELAEQPRARARLLDTIGVVYERLGLYEPARRLLGEALELRLAEPGSPLEAAETLAHLAHVHWQLGETGPAGELYDRALEIRRRILGPDHLLVAATLDDLGMVADLAGRFDEAAALVRQGLDIRERAVGPRGLEVADSLSNLGVVELDRGDPDAAEPLLRRALELREEHLGREHPAVADVLNGLGLAVADLDRRQEALEYHQRALGIREAAFGSDHTEVGQSLNNLGGLLTELDRPAEALPLLRRALAVYESAYGPENPRTGISRFLLGDAEWRVGRRAEGEALLRAALRAFEVRGPDHPHVAIGAARLGEVLEESGRLQEAEQQFRRAVGIRLAEGRGDPELVAVASRLAGLLRRSGRAEQARDLELRAGVE